MSEAAEPGPECEPGFRRCLLRALSPLDSRPGFAKGRPQGGSEVARDGPELEAHQLREALVLLGHFGPTSALSG
jgi:hypothetical protein